MSVYSKRGKGWRYDFTHKGVRHTEAWFKNKREAMQAEARKREEVKNPASVAVQRDQEEPTDMGFLDMVNLRLDHVKAYNSARHYTDHLYLARKWVARWGQLKCSELTPAMIQAYLIQRRRQTSPYTANKELRYLRTVQFWHGPQKRLGFA